MHIAPQKQPTPCNPHIVHVWVAGSVKSRVRYSPVPISCYSPVWPSSKIVRATRPKRDADAYSSVCLRGHECAEFRLPSTIHLYLMVVKHSGKFSLPCPYVWCVATIALKRLASLRQAVRRACKGRLTPYDPTIGNSNIGCLANI
jgi:hypothetical protein